MNKEMPETLLTLESPEILRIKKEWEKALQKIGENLAITQEVASPREIEKASLQKLESQHGTHGFVIISAPSGGGKGTVGKSLENDGFVKLPRHTTRSPRPDEINGQDYFFISDEEFAAMDQGGDFFPSVETHGKRRATSKALLEKWVNQKKNFYLEGSTGAYNQIINDPLIKKADPLSVFLLPPSFEEHFNRLTNRPDNITNQEIIDRLQKAVEHFNLTLSSNYDAFLVNDDIARVTKLIIENYLVSTI